MIDRRLRLFEIAIVDLTHVLIVGKCVDRLTRFSIVGQCDHRLNIVSIVRKCDHRSTIVLIKKMQKRNRVDLLLRWTLCCLITMIFVQTNATVISSSSLERCILDGSVIEPCRSNQIDIVRNQDQKKRKETQMRTQTRRRSCHRRRSRIRNRKSQI